MGEDLKEYRSSLLQTVQKLNESYDKLIITLSGGALGLSFAFLKDVIKENQIQYHGLLIAAWGFFIMSLTSVLMSLLFGIAANKKAVKQVDAGKIYEEEPGGIFSKLTTWLHYSGTGLLIIGLGFITTFAYINMEAKDGKRQNTAKTTSKADERPREEKLGSTTTSSETAKTQQGR
jgi:hypothetical protein